MGRSLFEFLENTNITVAGTSEYIADKKNIFKTDYSIKSISHILNKTSPSVVYDFKTSLVSSNETDFNNQVQNVDFTKNIISSLTKYLESNRIKKINLISTNYLSDNSRIEDLKHPYLIQKKQQELSYLVLKDFDVVLNIMRPPTVVGKNDLNFSRLVPFYITTQLLDQETVLNSNPQNIKEFISTKTLNENLITDEVINFESVSYTNGEMIDLLNHLIQKNGCKTGKVTWKNKNDKLTTLDHKTNEEHKLKFENELNQTVKWYIENIEFVKIISLSFLKSNLNYF